MLASRNTGLGSGAASSKLTHDLSFADPVIGQKCRELLHGLLQRKQFLLVDLAAGRDVIAYCLPVSSDGDRGRRVKILGQVLAKLAYSDPELLPGYGLPR
jgi:hypothetical protein